MVPQNGVDQVAVGHGEVELPSRHTTDQLLGVQVLRGLLDPDAGVLET